MLVQAFIAELAVEAFHKGILCRLAWLDKAKLGIALLGSEEHCLASELRAVVADDHRRQPAPVA
jgi:hypothetical protein